VQRFLQEREYPPSVLFACKLQEIDVRRVGNQPSFLGSAGRIEQKLCIRNGRMPIERAANHEKRATQARDVIHWSKVGWRCAHPRP
jgi:hypothetical protein